MWNDALGVIAEAASVGVLVGFVAALVRGSN